MDKARKTPNEQGVKWREIGERLTESEQARNLLLQQGEKYSTLKNELSSIGKARGEFTVEDVRSIRTRVLDHVYSVLILISST